MRTSRMFATTRAKVAHNVDSNLWKISKLKCGPLPGGTGYARALQQGASAASHGGLAQ